MGAVRDMEALVNADKSIEVDDHDLEDKVEDVEASAVVVAREGLRSGNRWEVSGASAVGGTQTEGQAASEDDEDVVAKTVVRMAKFVHWRCARDGETYGEEDGRKERDKGEVGQTVQLDVAVNLAYVPVQCVEHLHNRGDEHDQCDYDQHVGRDEEE